MKDFEDLPLRHDLACDLLERALLLHGDAPACLQAVRDIRRNLDDSAVRKQIAHAMWELVPYRGLYPNVSGEPTWESLPAWAAATLADSPADAFSDGARIAGRAVWDYARQEVLDAKGMVTPALTAWRAALELPRVRGLPAHDAADAERARILGEPEGDWSKVLEWRACEAERAWQNVWLASKV